jgi:hypothetical protein
VKQVKVTVEMTVCFDEKRILLSEVKDDLREQAGRFLPQEAAPFRSVTGGSWWTDRAMVTQVADVRLKG